MNIRMTKQNPSFLITDSMMLSTSSSMKYGISSGSSELLTRLACIRQTQETVQDLAMKPVEITSLFVQFARFITQNNHQNANEKRNRIEAILEEINAQFVSLRHLFVRLREIHEYVLTRESTTTTNNTELSRLLKQKSIYEEILKEKQIQLKITIDTIRDIAYQINTMIDLRHDGTMNTLMSNANAQEK